MRVTGDQIVEIGVKGGHWALRLVDQAPEQRRARSLRTQAERLPPPEPDAPRVLILSMRDWAAHVQWEAMIAHGLRQRGAHVDFLTCGGGLQICDRTCTWEAPPMPCGSCTRYTGASLRAHGFAPQDLRSSWESDDEPWAELDLLSADELLGVEVDGLALGRLVEIPAKWFLLTTQLLEDPLGPATLRSFLRSARRVARAVRVRLDELQPDTVVLLNGLFMFEAVTKAICDQRGIDVVNYERGFIKETLFFARGRLACFGEIDQFWAESRDIALTDSQKVELDDYLDDRVHGRRAIEKYWRNVEFDELPRLTSGRRVSLFTNLTWDSAVIGKEIAFESIQEWITATIDFFADRPEDELVIRVHPAEVKLSGKPTREPLADFIHATYADLPANIVVLEPHDAISSYPLMEHSDAVTVFTSTVGLEAAMLGTPVIVSGETHYRNKGFTVDVSDPVEYIRALESVLDQPEAVRPDTDLVQRYAHLFFFGLPIPSPGVTEHFRGLARIDVRNLDETLPGRDAGMDRICNGILGSGDFAPPVRA